MALGYTMALPTEDRYLQSKTEFEDKIAGPARRQRRRAADLRRHDDRRQQRHREGDRPRPPDGHRVRDERRARPAVVRQARRARVPRPRDRRAAQLLRRGRQADRRGGPGDHRPGLRAGDGGPRRRTATSSTALAEKLVAEETVDARGVREAVQRPAAEGGPPRHPPTSSARASRPRRPADDDPQPRRRPTAPAPTPRQARAGPHDEPGTGRRRRFSSPVGRSSDDRADATPDGRRPRSTRRSRPTSTTPRRAPRVVHGACCASRASPRCRSTPPTAGGPPSGSRRTSSGSASSTSRSRRPAATRSSTPTGSTPPARRRSSSTATTTSSRSIRSTCGHRRRSSRSSATAGCSAAASADDKGQLHMHLAGRRGAPRDRGRAAGQPPVRLRGRGGVELAEHLDAWLEANRERLDRRRRASSATPASSRATCPAITIGLRGHDVRPDRRHGPDGRPPLGRLRRHRREPGQRARPDHRRAQGRRRPDPRARLLRRRRRARPTSERAAVAALPFDEEALPRASSACPALVGEAGYTTLERRGARPTLDVNGIWGGFQGEGAKTIIPAHAHAKVSCRLVADQDPDRIFEAFRDYVAEIAPPRRPVDVRLARRRPRRA